MKKSIIALAVAGALVAPLAQADATLYGSLRVKVTDYDNAETDVADNTSRIGIKGSTELFSGAKAIFQYEGRVRADIGEFAGTNGSSGNDNTRLSLIGATGDFGTVTMGKQWTPHYLWTGGTDMLDNGNSGASQAVFRAANTVAYITPSLGGFNAAAVVIADNNANSEDADAYNLAAKYAVGGLTVGASILTNEVTDNDITAVYGAYSMDALTVAARFEENETVAASQQDRYELAASYSMGNTTLLANYADFDDAGNTYSLEVQQKLGKKARVFAAYVGADSDAEATLSKADGIEVGYRVDF